MVLPPAAALRVPDFESVRHHDARPHRLVEMDMAVDAARQNQEARRVDLGRGARQFVGQGGDAAVLDADVAFADVGRGDHGSAPNDKIEFHCRLSAAELGRKIHANRVSCKPMLQSRARAGLNFRASIADMIPH